MNYRSAGLPGITCLLFAAISLAAEPATSISLKLPPSFPLEVPTVIPAQVHGPGSAAQTFQLKDPRLGPDVIVVQREAGARQVWFVGHAADQQLLGETARLQVTPHDTAARVAIQQQPGGFRFTDGSEQVMFYQQEPVSLDGEYTRAHFVHPLFGLDGEVLTQSFPEDHKHHHGVFWAWHQLWVGDQKVGDPWVTSDFLTVVRHARIVDQGPVFATLQVVADWTSPLRQDAAGRAEPIVREKTRIRLFRATRDARWIDFRIELKPLLPDVSIGGAENSRGYSGFTVRLKPPAQMRIEDAGGRQAEDLVGGTSSWADVSGVFAAGGQLSGVGMLSHNSLPEFPPRWLLRYYGMQNVVYPGREPVQLSPKQPLVLRHRLLIHRGHAQTARVTDQQKAYQDSP